MCMPAGTTSVVECVRAAMQDYRRINNVLKLHLGLLTIAALVVAFCPLYTVYVNTVSFAAADEAAYSMECYVYRAYIPNSDCVTPPAFLACYNILDEINRQHCDTDKLVVGSENLEVYSATSSIAATIVIVAMLCGYVALLIGAAPDTRITPHSMRDGYFQVASFCHFVAAAGALALVDSTTTTTAESTMVYTNGIGQTPVCGAALYVLSGVPLISLVLDNFHADV
jgi:hypothetical protein